MKNVVNMVKQGRWKTEVAMDKIEKVTQKLKGRMASLDECGHEHMKRESCFDDVSRQLSRPIT